MGDECNIRFKSRWTNNFGGETSNVNKSLSPPRDFFGTLNNFYLTNIYSIGIGDRYNGKTRYSRTDRTRNDVTMV